MTSSGARAAWGADEGKRFKADGTENSPAVYQPAQALTVHHTDTQNEDPDPAATVRAIYQHHAITNDWGDIGYPGGGRPAVYEGRWSGTDGLPAHDRQGRVVTGFHVAGFNPGNIGIALLGTLVEQGPTEAAEAALVRLAGAMAPRAGPEGADHVCESGERGGPRGDDAGRAPGLDADGLPGRNDVRAAAGDPGGDSEGGTATPVSGPVRGGGPPPCARHLRRRARTSLESSRAVLPRVSGGPGWPPSKSPKERSCLTRAGCCRTNRCRCPPLNWRRSPTCAVWLHGPQRIRYCCRPPRRPRRELFGHLADLQKPSFAVLVVVEDSSSGTCMYRRRSVVISRDVDLW